MNFGALYELAHIFPLSSFPKMDLGSFSDFEMEGNNGKASGSIDADARLQHEMRLLRRR